MPGGLRSLQAGLRASRLSGWRLFAYGIGAVTPLTVIVGAVSLGFGRVGQVGTPVGYLLAAGVLGVFTTGLAAMAGRVPNAGAFYSYAAAGLGKPAGAATGVIALLAYTAIHIGLYGAFGLAMQAALGLAGVRGWWAWWAVLGWAAVTVLSQLRLRTNTSVIGVLVAAEIAVVLLLDVALLAHPAGGQVRFTALDPRLLANPAGVASLVGAITGLVGFEVPLAFAQVAIRPRTTLRRAVQAILLVVAVLYGGSAFAMTVTAGPGRIVGVAAGHPHDLFFHLAAPYVPGMVIAAAVVLFATSLFAAMLAFAATVSRYALTLAREGVLPGWLAITRADEVPVTAALTQAGVVLAVLVVVVVAGLDPTVHLFFAGTVSGGLGVLICMTVTSHAVRRYLRRHGAGHGWARRRLAPMLAAVLLTAITAISVAFFGDLLGTTNPAAACAAPAVYLLAAAGGVGWACWLKTHRWPVYAAIGTGSPASAAGTSPARPPVFSRNH
ncbi:APC family permease [Mangrovihabitans endophyticus]|uniref:Amino acid permease n=1 Tax=Mangrovihabitans endophyticus TaxID=1751298 RepID=A0A8J3C611_9ACTN|nr:APC family permease [Mangrovihabitans endophyticus]GGL11908.1 amino acid permease [Mangrovihabitans endophyticus]